MEGRLLMLLFRLRLLMPPTLPLPAMRSAVAGLTLTVPEPSGVPEVPVTWTAPAWILVPPV